MARQKKYNRRKRLRRYSAIGANVRAARIANGWTQLDLVRRSGVSIGGLRHIESGKHLDPKLSTVIKLAQALGVPLAQLVGLEPPPDWSE